MSMLSMEGSAWTTTDKDPRWKFEVNDIVVGGFVMPKEIKDKIEELKKLYGEPPDDLEWHYMKY